MNFIKPDRKTRKRVGAGSWASKSENSPTKTGTMKSSMPTTAKMAITKTTTGYVMAALIFPLSLTSAS